MNIALTLRHTLPIAAIAFLLLSGTTRAQYVVGFNADVHNGTGQDAYDFHVQVTVEGTVLGNYIFSNGITPFDWSWQGATQNGTTFNGSWSGTTPIVTSQTIHVGMTFSAGPNYMYDVVGWWTDAGGNKINPLAGTAGTTSGTFYSDVPMLGFGIVDNTSTLTLKNSTTNAVTYRNIQVGLSTSAIALSDLNQSSSAMTALTWHSVDSAGVMASGAAQQYTLTTMGLPAFSTLDPSYYVIVQGEVFDPTIGTSGEYRWFGEEHQVIPEASTYAMVLGAFAAMLVLWRRRPIHAL